MAGYIYCMKNTHLKYGRYVKIGYTERTVEKRRTELCNKYFCKFEVIWDIPVYRPDLSEALLHEAFEKYRYEYEFFAVDAEVAKRIAENLLDENWREIEGKEILPPSLVDLAHDDVSGFLIEEDCSQFDPDREPEPN